MSSHNILSSLVFLGRDLMKLIIFRLSSTTSFGEGGIFSQQGHGGGGRSGYCCTP